MERICALIGAGMLGLSLITGCNEDAVDINGIVEEREYMPWF